jgi:hypothetical protein
MIGTIIGAGLSVASSIFGSKKAKKEARRARQELAAQEARDEAWYNRRYNEDYADTAAGQNLIRQAKDYAQQIAKRAEGAQAVTGASDAATAMAKDAGNKVVGNTLANVAAQDTARKASVDSQYNQMQHNATQQKIALHNQEAANITAAAESAGNALAQAGALYDYFGGMGGTKVDDGKKVDDGNLDKSKLPMTTGSSAVDNITRDIQPKGQISFDSSYTYAPWKTYLS